jgi:putative holliday junction resolvase
MRILALDYGTRRIGIALSDELKMIAQPLEFVPAVPFTDVVVRLKQLIQEKEVGLIIVGMPRNMDGTYGPAAERVQEFISELKKVIPLRIKKWDERLTTTQANRVLLQADVGRQQRKQVVDKMAAAILLQGYLDALNLSKES